ncbi:hypothetical protein E2320_012995, partial [Naja naja]
ASEASGGGGPRETDPPHGRVSLAPRPDAHSSRCPTPPAPPPSPAGTDLLAAAPAELTTASARARPGTSGGTYRKSALSGKRRPKAEKGSAWSAGGQAEERAPAAAAVAAVGGGRGRGAEPAGMAVQAAHLEADAFLVCLNHALSTEKEEVMGLCIGEVDTSRIVHIHSVIILRRLAELTGRPMRVVGWYHSHPHITVWPSHVDVRTQAMYQMMDQGFVGLIFSCFIEDKNTKTGRVLYTCFQSIQAQKSSEYERIEIPIHVVPHNTIGKVCLESAVELPKILLHEEPLQPDVCHQRASAAVAGGPLGAEQATDARAAEGERRALRGTGCLGVRMAKDSELLGSAPCCLAAVSPAPSSILQL